MKWETVSSWIIYLFAPHNYVALCIARALRTIGARQYVYDALGAGKFAFAMPQPCQVLLCNLGFVRRAC